MANKHDLQKELMTKIVQELIQSPLETMEAEKPNEALSPKHSLNSSEADLPEKSSKLTKDWTGHSHLEGP